MSLKKLLVLSLVLGAFSAQASSNQVVVCASQVSTNFIRLEFASPTILKVQIFLNDEDAPLSAPAMSLESRNAREVVINLLASRSALTLPKVLFGKKKVAVPVELRDRNTVGEILICRN